jgi:hypothetical protein
VTEPKRLVVLTDDNWADYVSFDYPESLVAGLQIPSDGIDRESKVVIRLLAWVALQSGQSRYCQILWMPEVRRRSSTACWTWSTSGVRTRR